MNELQELREKIEQQDYQGALLIVSELEEMSVKSFAELLKELEEFLDQLEKDGLAGNIVYAIAQAQDGSYWFGTNKGLSRFDGNSWHNWNVHHGLPNNDVYAIAEMIRRRKGGAAVVMGALSPRTRNAQVEMYQQGEVDYIVFDPLDDVEKDDDDIFVYSRPFNDN